MRPLSHIVFVFFFFESVLFAEGVKFSLYSPPFFTMTFEELENLKEPLFKGAQHQQELYLSEINEQLLRLSNTKTSVRGLPATLATLKKISKSKESWNHLRELVFNTCKENTENLPSVCKTAPEKIGCQSPLSTICDNLIATRQRVLHLYSGSHQPSSED